MDIRNPHPAHGWQIRLVALLLTLLPHTTVFSDIYKWKDDSGEVHYTQARPPTGITAETIEGAPPPPENQAEVRKEEQKLQQQVDEMNARIAQQDEADTENQQHEQLAEANKKNCIAAQNNLSKLQLGGNRRYLTPDGEVIRLTEEERQQRTDDANEQIKKYCT